LADLDAIDRDLRDPELGARLRWAHTEPEQVVATYRLVAAGLRAGASRGAGRLDAEARALAERRDRLDGLFAQTERAEDERDAMLADAQLALNAGERRDTGAARASLGRVLARADDLRKRHHGKFDADQADVVRLAAELTARLGEPLVADLQARLAAASTALAAQHDPALRAHEGWLEIDAPLTAPAR